MLVCVMRQGPPNAARQAILSMMKEMMLTKNFWFGII